MKKISKKVIQNVSNLNHQFTQAQPFKYVVVDNFFDPVFCQSLVDDFPSFEKRYALNEMGQVGGKAVRMDVRDISDSYRAIDTLIQTPEFLTLIENITGVKELLYDVEYIGGGTHENCDTQALDSHVDFNYHPTTGWHRRLNLIVYLNHEWDAGWGGNIQLLEDPWNSDGCEKKEVLPLFNRLVIFETNEVSWHGFETINLPSDKKHLSRRSFAIYLYTKDRPADERVPSHATVYVPAGLPKNLVVGEAITQERIDDLNMRFGRMLSQLKFLYQRELHSSDQIASLQCALEEARSVQNIGLQGEAEQQLVKGIWPDGWVSKDFLLTIKPKKRLSSINLSLWIPDEIREAQTLTLCLDGQCQQIELNAGKTKEIKLSIDKANQTHQLTIQAEQAWIPASQSESSDQRSLAWLMHSVEVV